MRCPVTEARAMRLANSLGTRLLRDRAMVQEHALAVDSANPADCTPDHTCGGHDAEHVHGDNCDHATVPHGDHVDYFVDGHLHHPDGSHYDFHGVVATAV